jgi:hypothetical protein
VPPWICLAGLPECSPQTLCRFCYSYELKIKSGQAGVLGQQWCEAACRQDARCREAWPAGSERSLAIARGKVTQLAQDPRLLEELARACDAGAAAWWERRPARFRP